MTTSCNRSQFRASLFAMTMCDQGDLPSAERIGFGPTFAALKATRVTTEGLRLTCRLIPRRAAPEGRPLVTPEQLRRAQMALITGADEPTAHGFPETTIFDDDASVVVTENAK
jgi:hypothetical protein